MTSLEAIAKLQLLLDKTGSPYFTTDEYLSFLNMAQLEALNRMVPDTLGGNSNYEIDENVSSNLRRLMFDVGVFSTPGSVVKAIDLSIALSSASSDPSATIFRILNLRLIDGTDVKFSRHNNIRVNTSNSFKSSNYYYTHLQDGFKIYPVISTGTIVIASLIKTPLIMTSSNIPDWDDYVMNQIIQIAYQMATVATRDDNGLQLGTNTTMQSK